MKIQVHIFRHSLSELKPTSKFSYYSRLIRGCHHGLILSLTSLFVYFILSGCSGAALNRIPSSNVEATSAFEKPCWIYGPCGEYDSAAYLIGVGIASLSSEADEKARVNIAKTFRVHIRDRQQTIERQIEKNGTLGQWYESILIQTWDIVTESEETVRGIQIVERWEKDGNVYSLAALEKEPAIMRIRIDLDQLDSDVTGIVDQLDSERSRIQRLRLLTRATTLMSRYEALNSRLGVLTESGGGRRPSYSMNHLIKEQKDIVSRSNCKIQVEGPSDRAIEQALCQAVTENGFSLEPESRADILIKVRVESMERKKQYGSYELIANEMSATIEVRDPSLRGAAGNGVGRVMGSYQYRVSITSVSSEKALRLVTKEITELIKKGNKEVESFAHVMYRILFQKERKV